MTNDISDDFRGKKNQKNILNDFYFVKTFLLT